MSRLSVKAATRLNREMRKHGAITTQIKAYLNLVRLFEKQSSGVGELHHILPINCGWWKSFSKCRWNITEVSWGSHIALHAMLVDVFPDNGRLLSALRATTMRRPLLMARLEKQAFEIHAYYFSGEHSLTDTAKKFGTSNIGMNQFFATKGWSRRTSGQQTILKARRRIRAHANDIYDIYFVKGRPLKEVVRQFHVADYTIAALFKDKNWKIRSPKEQQAIENVARLLPKKDAIYQLYFHEWRTWAFVCRKFGCRDTPTGSMADFFKSQGWTRRTILQTKSEASIRRLRLQASRVHQYYFVDKNNAERTARKFHTSPEVVRRLFKEQNWVVRTPYQQWVIGNSKRGLNFRKAA